eukprot:6188558-Pleurochrysis_carterae.AAC.2
MELTSGGGFSKPMKDKIVEALRDEHKIAYTKLPTAWKQGVRGEGDLRAPGWKSKRAAFVFCRLLGRGRTFEQQQRARPRRTCRPWSMLQTTPMRSQTHALPAAPHPRAHAQGQGLAFTLEEVTPLEYSPFPFPSSHLYLVRLASMHKCNHFFQFRDGERAFKCSRHTQSLGLCIDYSIARHLEERTKSKTKINVTFNFDRRRKGPFPPAVSSASVLKHPKKLLKAALSEICHRPMVSLPVVHSFTSRPVLYCGFWPAPSAAAKGE